MNNHIENPLETLYPEVTPMCRFLCPLRATRPYCGARRNGLWCRYRGLHRRQRRLRVYPHRLCRARHKTPRRIRAQARGRFPSADWKEHQVARRLNLALIVPVIVGAMGLLVIAGFWYIPPRCTVGGCIIAAIVAITMWFMPGLNPMWSKRNELPPLDATQSDDFPLPSDDHSDTKGKPASSHSPHLDHSPDQSSIL